MLETIHRGLERVARVAVWIAGVGLLFAAFLVSIDVVLRKLFSMTVGGADEVSGYVFAIGTALAFSYCVLHRANVRIDALYNLLPRRAMAVLDVLGTGLLLLYAGALTERALAVLRDSWAFDSHAVSTLRTPLWIPQSLWVAGLLLFVVTLTFVFLVALLSLIRGDYVTVRRVAGIRSVEEEIEEETHGMGFTLTRHGQGGP